MHHLRVKKFNADKRKVDFSALVRSKPMTREAALRELSEQPSDDDQEVKYCIDKLGLSDEEFREILKS